MTAPGNAYPAVMLDANGQPDSAGVTLQFTDDSDQPGSGGGGGGNALFMTAISGSPAGVTTPTGIGYLIQDTTNGALYIAVGMTNADWAQVGGVLSEDVVGFGVTL